MDDIERMIVAGEKAATIATLRADLDSAERTIGEYRTLMNTAFDQRDKAPATVAALREALGKYGKHDGDCSNRWPYLQPCDCGLTAALAHAPAAASERREREKRSQIARSLRDKEYRDAFVQEHIETGVPFQIREMRRSRGWTQRELGERIEMKQETISKFESMNYGSFTLRTLKRLASAFDVALIVRFAPYSELVDFAADLSPEDLAVPSYADDQRLVALDGALDGPTPRAGGAR
jgi:transcriptional regulator with XRE-family HTH domain